jgi:hypothetical protein
MFKTGHIPMYREVKITGETIGKLKKWLELTNFNIGNYHKEKH